MLQTQVLKRVSKHFDFIKRRLTKAEMDALGMRKGKSRKKLTQAEIEALGDSYIDGSIPGQCAPWFLSVADRAIFDKLCRKFLMPTDKDGLRRPFRDGPWLKTENWMALCSEPGRFLLRKALPSADVPKEYIELFCAICEILEDIGSTYWTEENLDKLERRIEVLYKHTHMQCFYALTYIHIFLQEMSVWRDVMFPLNYSASSIHHTLLHLVANIRRHGPAPTFWNFTSERHGGEVKRMLHSYNSIESGIMFSHAVKVEFYLREAAREPESVSISPSLYSSNTL
jgi:hypothetical protein